MNKSRWVWWLFLAALGIAAPVFASQPLNIMVEAGESFRIPFDSKNHHSVKVIFANRFDGASICRIDAVSNGKILNEGQIGTEDYRIVNLVRKNFMLERIWHPGQDVDEFIFNMLEGEMRLRIFYVEH